MAWAHGTTGYAPKCAPSLLPDPYAVGALPPLDEVLANGWVLVATDYIGLGTEGPHPYLIGEPSGRAVLDAVRAARTLDDVELGPRTVVWGHSQGGGAALWTGIIGPRYAPDANVVGVAAMAPGSDLPAVFDAVQDSAIGKIVGSYVVSAHSEVYPDVGFDDYVRPAARTFAREAAGRCFIDALASIGTADPVFSKQLWTGALGKRLEENIPKAAIEAPLLIVQGLADPLILPSMQRRYVDRLCRSGLRLEYRTYDGVDHVEVVGQRLEYRTYEASTTSRSSSRPTRRSSPTSSRGRGRGSVEKGHRPAAGPSRGERPATIVRGGGLDARLGCSGARRGGRGSAERAGRGRTAQRLDLTQPRHDGVRDRQRSPRARRDRDDEDGLPTSCGRDRGDIPRRAPEHPLMASRGRGARARRRRQLRAASVHAGYRDWLRALPRRRRAHGLSPKWRCRKASMRSRKSRPASLTRSNWYSCLSGKSVSGSTPWTRNLSARARA